MPSANDVYITPASKKIEFYDSSSVVGKLYYSSPYMYLRGDATSGLAFEGNNGLHYFVRSSANNRLFVYNYADGSGYATYAANYLQLRDGSSNIEAYLVAGNGSFVSGNLGVGTSSASAKLHVQGTSKLNDWVYLSGSASQRIGGYDTQIWSIANGGTTPATVRNVFATSLNWDNNVELRYQIPSTVGDGSGVLKFGQIQKNNTNYSHGETQFFTSGAAQLTIKKDGKVGIGTTSPSEKFYVETSNNTVSKFKSTDNRGLIQVSDDDTTVSIVAENSTASIGQTSQLATTNININTSGHLGIGTTSPNAPLDVLNTSTQQRWSYDGTYHTDITVASDGDTEILAEQGTLALKTNTGGKAIRLDSKGDVQADLGGSSGTYLFKVVDSSVNWLFTVHDDGLVGLHGSDPAIEIKERSSAPNHTNTFGKLWVKNDNPTNLYFTDDDGNDIALTNNGSAAGGGGGTIGGSISSGKLAIGTGADTIGNFVDALTETDSIYIGANPTSTTNDAGNNVSLGIQALEDTTTADSNVAIGYRAGKDITSGGYNTLIGDNAGSTLTTTNHNIAIGYESMKFATSAEQNTAIGYHALGEGTLTGDENVAIGQQSLADATSATKNVAIGQKTGEKVTSASGSVILGWEAGATLTDAHHNTYIGAEAGKLATSAYGNVGIGRQAFGSAGTATGYNNVAVGNQALKVITSSIRNVAIGFQAGAAKTTGTPDVLIGAYAGGGISTQGANVIVGTYAGQNTTSDKGVFLGYQSGYYATGDGNVYMGYQSGFGNASTNNGTYNTAVGYEAMEKVQDADENVAVGSQALWDNTSGDGNTSVGTNALYRNTTAHHNVAVGHRAMFTSTTAAQNVAVGKGALYDLTEGDDNVAVGKSAGADLNTGHKNIAIGTDAMRLATTAHSSVAIGYQALDSTTLGSENVAIGTYAGQALVGTTSSVYGGFSTFIGHTAGYQITGNVSYGGNTMVGHAAGYSATGADRSTGLGASALYYADGAKYNTAVGRVAGAYAKGTGSTHVGDSSGYRISGNYNTSIGYKALSGASSGAGAGTAELNVAIGYSAMEDSTDAAENVAVGTFAGGNITTGDYNTAIGYAALRSGAAMSRQVAVGYFALGNYKEASDSRNTGVGMYAMSNIRSGSANVALGYEALKGVNSSSNDCNSNTAVGREALISITSADNNTALGYQAGQNNTTGDGNVFLGKGAGPSSTSTASNELYIHNSASSTPLIKGDFSSQFLKINGGIIQNQTEALYLYDAVGGVYANPAIVTPLGNFALIKPEVGPGVGAIPVQLPEGTAARVGFETTIVNNVAADPASTLSVTVAQGTSDVIYEGSSNSASSTVSIGTYRGANKTFLLVDTGVWIVKA